MIERSAQVRNAHGIHCRPSTVIAQTAGDYAGELRVCVEDDACDPRRILDLMALGLAQGEQVRIQVDGPEEEAFCDRLVELFETRFDFPPRTVEK